MYVICLRNCYWKLKMLVISHCFWIYALLHVCLLIWNMSFCGMDVSLTFIDLLQKSFFFIFINFPLKRGLAFSTMSQLSYTVLALGMGSYWSALFHLICNTKLMFNFLKFHVYQVRMLLPKKKHFITWIFIADLLALKID